MAALDFEEVAALVNHSRTTHIDLKPIQKQDGQWAYHRGHYKAHTSTFPFGVLSLGSRVTKEAMERAAKEVFVKGETHVVYASSIDSRTSAHRDLFERSAKEFRTIKDYLKSFVTDELELYLSTVSRLRPAHYVDPQVKVPAGVPRKIPNPLLTFLRDPLPQSGEGAVSVLLAEPGQGKTFMSRYLVSSLADAKVGLVPILIDSSQWHGLTLTDLGSLWKTITHSFRHFEAPITWLEGHEEQFLRVALKADLLRIVFDGFDEYVLRNGGLASASEVLGALVELASSTSTRILVTSRTAFWEMNIPDAEVEQGRHLYLNKILPFDSNHARQYFGGRLESRDLVVRAVALYDELRAQDEQLVGRGFVLSLIADVVARSDAQQSLRYDGDHALRWLLTALCQRETLRQSLLISAAEQMATLRQFAVETAMGEDPSSTTLDYALSICRPDLLGPQRSQTLERMRTHPVLRFEPNTESWEFQQEAAQIMLVAEEILGGSPAERGRLAEKLKLDGGTRENIAASVIDLVCVAKQEVAAMDELRAMIEALAPRDVGKYLTPVVASDSRRLAASLLLAAVDRFRPSGSDQRERRDLLLNLAGGGLLSGLVFSGTVARYNLTGTVFQSCMFEHVTWANCSFDVNTRFVNCDFVGGSEPLYCRGFGLLQFSDCRLDQGAAAIVRATQISEGQRSYAKEDLSADLRTVVGKFIGRGGAGLRSVAAPNLAKGVINSPRNKALILDTLKRLVIEEHQVSGLKDGAYHIREEAAEAVRFFAANNVFTGRLAEAFERIRSDLNLG